VSVQIALRVDEDPEDIETVDLLVAVGPYEPGTELFCNFLGCPED
jgi:hypothetical protein